MPYQGPIEQVFGMVDGQVREKFEAGGHQEIVIFYSDDRGVGVAARYNRIVESGRHTALLLDLR
jgi:hypothetical protein